METRTNKKHAFVMVIHKFMTTPDHIIAIMKNYMIKGKKYECGDFKIGRSDELSITFYEL